MLKPGILIAATVAGLAGFGWTLVSYSAPPGTEAEWSGYGSSSPNRWEVRPRVAPPERIRQLKGILAENPGDANAWYQLGLAQRLTGDDPGAAQSWANAVEAHTASWPILPDNQFFYNLACYRARAGDREGALAAWEASVEFGWNDRDWARSDADLDSIRTDPRFVEVFRKIPRRTIRLNAG